MDKRIIQRIREIVYPTIVMILVITCWELFASTGRVNNVILPKFSEVVVAVGTNYTELLHNSSITFFESIMAFTIGSISAFIFALLFTLNKNLKVSMMPFAIAMKATPLIALAPLIILWLGNGMTSKIFMGAIFLFFTVLINSMEGLNNVQKEQLDLLKSYNASKIHVLLKLRIPNSMPFVFSALKISSTLAVVGVVIGEFTGSTEGLGYVMLNSSYYLDTPLLFACILTLSLWGVLFYGIIIVLEYLLIKMRMMSKHF